MATEEISVLTFKKETVLILADFKILLFIDREREQLHGTIIKCNHLCLSSKFPTGSVVDQSRTMCY